jgi:hypothetical protein
MGSKSVSYPNVSHQSNNVRYKTSVLQRLSVTGPIIATVIMLVTRNAGAGIFYTKHFSAL